MYFVDFLSVLYNKECLQENNIRVRISLLLFSYLMLQSLMMVSQMAPMQSIMIRWFGIMISYENRKDGVCNIFSQNVGFVTW